MMKILHNFFIVWFEILRLDYHVVSDWIFSLVFLLSVALIMQNLANNTPDGMTCIFLLSKNAAW